jgi:hypothetical protein
MNKFQWVYIQWDKFSTIEDLSKYIAMKNGLSDAPPNLFHKQLELYLEEPFVLPSSEDIRLLQNGDLVLVKEKYSEQGNVNNISQSDETTQRNIQINYKPSSNKLSSKLMSVSSVISKESRDSDNSTTDEGTVNLADNILVTSSNSSTSSDAEATKREEITKVNNISGIEKEAPQTQSYLTLCLSGRHFN